MWIVLQKRLIRNIESYLVKENVGRGGSLDKTIFSPIALVLVKLFQILPGSITIIRVPTSCPLCSPTLCSASYLQRGIWVRISLCRRSRISNIFTVYLRNNGSNSARYIWISYQCPGGWMHEENFIKEASWGKSFNTLEIVAKMIFLSHQLHYLKYMIKKNARGVVSAAHTLVSTLLKRIQ